MRARPVVGFLVLLVGAAVTFAGLVGGVLAPTWSATLVWLVPESIGCLLVVIGLRIGGR